MAKQPINPGTQQPINPGTHSSDNKLYLNQKDANAYGQTGNPASRGCTGACTAVCANYCGIACEGGATGIGSYPGTGSVTKKVNPDTTTYYVKYSDIYEVYPYTKTSHKDQWEKDRDKGILYTRYDTLQEILDDYNNNLKTYYNDANNFKVTDKEKEKITQQFAEGTESYQNAIDELIESKKQDWAKDHHYEYYEFLYNVCETIPGLKEKLSKIYDQFIKDYETISKTDGISSIDIETLINYNKNGLILRYPTIEIETANEIQARDEVYLTYKKFLEKQLKNYQADLDKLNKIATTLTSSTSEWKDEQDRFEENSIWPLPRTEDDYFELRTVNINRRYKDYGNPVTTTDDEVNYLLSEIGNAGERYQERLNTISSDFTDNFKALYNNEEYTPEVLVDTLSDIYNKSELSQVRRILNKYDDKDEPEIDVDEYVSKKEKLEAKRDAQKAGYESQLDAIQKVIDEYNTYKTNLQNEINTLQNEIKAYQQDIVEAQARIKAANDKLNQYGDDEIEGSELIDYFANNPDIQKNVNILKTYLEWLNSIEENIKLSIAAAIGGDVTSITDYLSILEENILNYSKEAFYFFHYFDALEEDLEDILTTSLKDNNFGIGFYKNILYLGLANLLQNTESLFIRDSVLDNDSIIVNGLGEYDSTNESLFIENVTTNIEDSNSIAYFKLCETFLRNQLLLPNQNNEEIISNHTYKFGVLTINNVHYLVGIDEQDSDEYYPIPQWIGVDAPPDDVIENNQIMVEGFAHIQQKFINARNADDISTIYSTNAEQAVVGNYWLEDKTSLSVYRPLPVGTEYKPNKVYYNLDNSEYQFINTETWNLDVENQRVQWKTGRKILTFEISDYTMLYDNLEFVGKLEKDSQDPIFVPQNTVLPIHPHQIATYYQDVIGNAVYEYEENLVGSLSRLQIFETEYRASLLNYIYALISQNDVIENTEINDDYATYVVLREKYQTATNELKTWQAQLASLQQVYESGWSVNEKESDQGKKKQLEELIYIANQQIAYYQDLINIYLIDLEGQQYGNYYAIDTIIDKTIRQTTNEYNNAKQKLQTEYNTYAKKVEHYLNLLFNTQPYGKVIDSTIVHSLKDNEYSLGIGPAINSYKKYYEYSQEGQENIDFSALINRINTFFYKYREHYELYELVSENEAYQPSKYKYYYKVGDAYKPYGEYVENNWHTNIATGTVYKINRYLEDFNNVIYTLVPSTAIYNSEILYFVKNTKENNYNLFNGTEDEWNDYKVINNLYTMSIGENGGILQFLNNLLANSNYVNSIVQTYNDSLALYNSLVAQQLGDTTSYQELIDAKNRYEQQLKDLQEITQYKDHMDINHTQAYLDIIDALTKYLQALTIAYVDQVEKRYEVA